MRIAHCFIFVLVAAAHFHCTIGAQTGDNNRKCSDGTYQENSRILCEVWFNYGAGNVNTNPTGLEPTTAAKSWLSSQGLEQTHDAMCTAEAPWPLDNSNHIEVQTVCQSICNYCSSGTAYTTVKLVVGGTTAPTTAAPGSAAAKYFTAYACDGTSATYTTSTETAGTMCCPIAGGACAGTCASASTWSTAVLSCALNGMRLCSRGELLDELCCGQGDTTCDTSAVWTLTVEGAVTPAPPPTTTPPPIPTTGPMTGYPSTTPPETTASLVYPETTKSPPATTTGYPPTDPPTTTEAVTTTEGYPTTETTTDADTTTELNYPSTTDPARKLCSNKMKKLCPCGCGFKMTKPKIKCKKIQKRLCPCKCNNL